MKFLLRAAYLCGTFLLYLPLVTLVIYSFIRFDNRHEGFQFTLDWYLKAASDVPVLEALGRSLWVGFCSTLAATWIGTWAALALERTRFRGSKLLNFLTYVPLIMPEIVLGLSLLIWFVFLNLTLGTFSVILAHITFSISYVILTVRTRLTQFDRTLEEAARDLGASPLQTFRKVTFPLIWPAVLSGGLIAFTLSFDDFMITYFTAGVASETLPLKIYSMVKFGVSPEINAISTVMLAVTLFIVLLVFRPNARE